MPKDSRENQMLLEFRLKNWLSFRDEQILSLVASPDTALQGNCIEWNQERILKTAAIYGANASGKSNVIKAVDFMQSLVANSGEMQAGAKLGHDPFLLDAESARRPTLFEATFVTKGIRYQYGFTLTAERVESEWLYAYPSKRVQRWYERDFDRKLGKQAWQWGPALKGQKQRISGLTRPNALLLSVAAKFNHEQLTPVYEWFRSSLRPLPRVLGPVTARILTSPELGEAGRSRFNEAVQVFLRDADLGLTDLRVDRRKIGEADIPRGSLIPEELKKQILESLKEEYAYDVRMLHANRETGKDVPFPLEQESDGTKRLFELAGPWFEARTFGYTVFVDELEASLHPLLTRALIRFFQSPEWNDEGAQLVFATHDTNLLDPEILRRDQVWFTEKDADGASHLYSLYEYKEHRARKGEALQKGYLAGRYGAIPILGRFGLE